MRSWLRSSPLLIALLACAACVPPRSAPGGGPIAVPDGTWLRGAVEPAAPAPLLAAHTAREAYLGGDGSQLLVEARLNGAVSGTFLIDTGASYCVITPETARLLGLGHLEAEEPVVLATPTGEIEAPLTTLQTIEVADARAGNITAVIYPAVDEPLSGILGLSFLSQFEFSVDARRRVLRLRPF
jgi:clan AA aspartic protease (TIGR02281 family)